MRINVTNPHHLGCGWPAEYEMIEVSRDDRVATVRMDHGSVNAMDLELVEAIAETFAKLDGGGEVDAIVLTGNERAFSAGVDLRRILDGGEGYTRDFLDGLSRAILAPLRTTVPVVAAVNGHAIAGGAVLASAADHVVVTDDPGVRIGLSELAVGVPFPTAAIEVMRRRLGSRLGPAVWLADLYAPDEAHARRFVDEVVPADELLDHAADAARRLGGVPAATRLLTHEQLAGPVEEAVAARAGGWDTRVADAWCSDEGRAAISDFARRTFR